MCNDGWRKIDTAPKDGTTVLVVRDGRQVLKGRFWGGHHWSIDGNPWGGEATRMTAWMPLPEPPNPEGSA